MNSQYTPRPEDATTPKTARTFICIAPDSPRQPHACDFCLPGAVGSELSTPYRIGNRTVWVCDHHESAFCEGVAHAAALQADGIPFAEEREYTPYEQDDAR